MDAREFEALSRRVAHLAGRRSLLRAVIAAPVVARITVAEDGEAKRKRRRKKKKKGSGKAKPLACPPPNVPCGAKQHRWLTDCLPGARNGVTNDQTASLDRLPRLVRPGCSL
jgi:hypothetical protein